MSFERTSQEYENQRLKAVLAVIGEQLVKSRKATEDMKQETISLQKSMWDNINPTPRDTNDLVDIWQFQTELEREGAKAILAAKKVAKLERMLGNPYFGRLDFREEGESAAEQIYIGVSNLSDERTHEHYVYDWRAPISSMFYDYETGSAGYDCPVGRIEGNIDLKRQYRIWQGRLELMFDCSLAIDDDILQEILSRSADSRMKTIVTSIQREQNKVIRNDKHRLLVVHGPAGSGKTSIALHRAAYLLYRYRKDIKAENIAIFSPNRVFSDYISDVLPELGEENIRRTTFLEYARFMLGKAYSLEDAAGMMEYLLTGKDDNEYKIRTQGMEYKASHAFMELLGRYARYIEENWSFEDITYNGLCIEAKKEITEYFRVGLKFLPISKRLDKIRNRLISKIDPLVQVRIEELVQELAKSGEYPDKAEIRGRSIFIAREEFRPVRDTVERMTHFEAEESYLRLFRDARLQEEVSGGSLPCNIREISTMTLARFERGEVSYEDIAPFLYLTGLLSGISSIKEIKHVIVDEIQDYSVIQLELLHKLFRDSSLTLLGDPSQSINPFAGNMGSNAIADVFCTKSSQIIRLGKSYRSTKQITTFCRKILTSDDEGGYMEREGAEPVILCRDTAEELYESVERDIALLSGSGCRSIAVICRTAEASREAHARLSGKLKLRLISGSDVEYVKGISVIPSYLSKGLEFDAVLVLCTSGEDYNKEIERKLLYTVCTRALHRLNVYCLKQPVPLLTGTGNDINMA
jgi:DNA helicase II / ATP-dependent DNA helicase PcrA